MNPDVEILTTGEEFLTEYSPYPVDHLPREGESLWVGEHGRRRVEHVIHSPLERRVAVVVSDEPNSTLTPGELAEGGSDE